STARTRCASTPRPPARSPPAELGAGSTEVGRRGILPAVRGGRSWTAAALATAALAALALAPAALALPGDPGFTATTPADGANLPVDADGIPVAFTCPLYRISDAGGGFVQYGGGDDYGVSFARAATLGPDG